VAVSEGIVGAAATLKEPVLVPDVSADPPLSNGEIQKQNRKLGDPDDAQGKVIGVLDLESPQF